MKSILDNDLYKFTMQQAVFLNYPMKMEAVYRFVNRSNERVTFHQFKEISRRIDALDKLGFKPNELKFISGLGIFCDRFLSYLKTFTLDASKIHFEYNGEQFVYRDWETDRKSTRLNSSHITRPRMPSSA